MNHDPDRRRTPWFLAGVLTWAVVGCVSSAPSVGDVGPVDAAFVDSFPADSPVIPPQRAYREPPACIDGRAPFLSGRGQLECRPVGAHDVIAEGMSLTQLRVPEVWVDTRATADGDGSEARPFRTFAAALATSPGTIRVTAGVQHLPGTLELSGTVTVVGQGISAATGTTLTLEHVNAVGQPVVAASGDAAGVRLVGVRIAVISGSGPLPTGVAVTAGATATLQGVSVAGLYRGIDVRSGHLRVDGVTVAGAADYGVLLREGSDGSLKSLLVQNGAESGIVVQGSTVNLTESEVYNQGSFGVVLEGANLPGTRDRLERVVVWRNARAGIYASGAGRASDLFRVLVTGTRRVPGAPDADGLAVRRGAAVQVEPALVGDGFALEGSMFVANARTGIVASDPGTTLVVHATVAGSNLGGGLVVQTHARSTGVGYSHFVDNDAFGAVVVDQGGVVDFDCNLFNGQRAIPAFQFGTGTFALGEGLIVAPGGAAEPVTIRGCTFDGNQGFGALLLDVSATTDMNHYNVPNGRGEVFYRGIQPIGQDHDRAQNTDDLRMPISGLFTGAENQPMTDFAGH